MTNLWRSNLSFIGFIPILFAIVPARAQDETPTKVTDQNRSGDLPFSTTVGSDVEHVVVSSGNLVVTIPILGVPGRGMPFNFALRYDGRLFVTALRTTPNNHQIWNFEKHPYLTTQGIWAVSQPALSSSHYELSQCALNVQGGVSGDRNF